MYSIANPINFLTSIDRFINTELSPRFFDSHFRVQMTETEDQFLIKAEIPGVEKSDISIEFNKDKTLVISVNTTQSKKYENQKILHNEFRSLSSSRQFCFSQKIEESSIRAVYEHGILTVYATKIKPVNESADGTNKIIID